MVIFPHILKIPQQLHCGINQIVKIECPCLQKTFLIGVVHLGNKPRTRICGRAHGVLRADHLVFQTADGADGRFQRKKLVVDVHRLIYFFHGALLIVRIINGKALGIPQPAGFPAQDTHACRMECRCVDILTCFTQHGGKTIFQFPRRLVCKGDGENIIGAHRVLPQERPKSLGRLAAAVQQAFQLRHLFRPGALRRICAAVRAAETNQIRNTVDKHRRFAAARPRQDQQRPVCGKYRVPLHRVQLSELRLNILFAQCKELCFKLGFHCFPPLVVFWRILFMRTIVFSIAYLHLIEKKKPLPKERLFP